MANKNYKRGRIGILTGGGDVPGLNPAIRAVTIRAVRENYEVVGLRRGWGGLIDMKRDKKVDEGTCYQVLNESIVNKAGRTGGTFLHSSRTRPSHVSTKDVPEHLKSKYPAEKAGYVIPKHFANHLADHGASKSLCGEIENLIDRIFASKQELKKELDALNLNELKKYEPILFDQLERKHDLTPDVLENLNWLGIDYLIAIGGDDTLSYAVHLHKKGVKVVAIPKTMDNDVPGTDYCIGFSTCVTRTINLTNRLRTSAGSHERILVIEVFGRYAGFTALLPTMAGAANRCVIPEHRFDIKRLTELLVSDRNKNPSKYSVVLVSEGAIIDGFKFTASTFTSLQDDKVPKEICNKLAVFEDEAFFTTQEKLFAALNDKIGASDTEKYKKEFLKHARIKEGDMMYSSKERDPYGHAKLGGIGDLVSAEIKELSPEYNNGKRINIINQKLGYLVRGGDPDAIDSIVPMAYGNLALDLILKGIYGRLVVLRNGRYDSVPVEVVTSTSKVVEVDKFYNIPRLRPHYTRFEGKPLFIMTNL